MGEDLYPSYFVGTEQRSVQNIAHEFIRGNGNIRYQDPQINSWAMLVNVFLDEPVYRPKK
ncbi:MAG: hypothetical protein CVV22_02660 [Ignavibacteriae bacterium HGW-Ignavibacteriae-1]|jgi:hypothetical protein|nr:MAG: hypothetical protein CVV22_02660 [Ignavibacteriae bacterium HGW-Ignavibacteriae-1]